LIPHCEETKMFKSFTGLIAGLTVFCTFFAADVLSQQSSKAASEYTEAWRKDSKTWRQVWPENESPKTVRVTDNIYLLHGVGGSTVVLSGPDGVLLVDTGHPRTLESRLFPMVNKITGDKAVRFVINTHSHGDHTAGNAYYVKQGALAIAHMVARSEMASPPPHYPRMPPKGFPSLTFNDRLTLHFNGQTIELIHAPFGHTKGDVIVHFREANVVHTGDIFIYHGYVSTAAGDYKDVKGTTQGLIEEQEMVLSLGDDKTKFITGHSRGLVSTREDLERDHDVLVTIAERIQLAIKAGKSLDEVQAMKPGKEFDDSYAWPGMTPERTVKKYYEGSMEIPAEK